MVETQSQNILNYVDYRAFLRDYFSAEKAKNPNWSFGIWARKLQVKSKSSLTMIMKGQRRPGPGIYEKMCLYFNFDQEQREHFRRLLRMEKQIKDVQAQQLLQSIIGPEPVQRSSEDTRRLIQEFENRLVELSN